jgi:hypothetical protein
VATEAAGSRGGWTGALLRTLTLVFVLVTTLTNDHVGDTFRWVSVGVLAAALLISCGYAVVEWRTAAHERRLARPHRRMRRPFAS